MPRGNRKTNRQWNDTRFLTSKAMKNNPCICQMMCFYSRQRQNMKRWHHMEQILNERSLKQTLDKFNRYHTQTHERSDVPSNYQIQWYDTAQLKKTRALLQLVPVANDHFSGNSSKASTTSSSTSTQTSSRGTDFSQAAEFLTATLGSIEFRLGMENLRANELEVALSHLKLATSHHHPEATFNLGVCYELGLGVQKNLKNAMECYSAAAGLGNKKAMYNLGVFYNHGRGGLKKNREAARACFEAANKKGLDRAARALTLPEKPIKKDEEILWKSNDLIAEKLNASRHRRQSSVI